MKKTMSMIQVEANRANARKSTGPKTAEGKANSRRNALKRGILAREVVLHEETGGERASEFWALHRGFWQHLEPEGPVEESLVERMVTAYWRLHRVLIAERGEIVRRQIGAECRVGGLDGGLGLLMLSRGGMQGGAADVAKEMEALQRVRGSVAQGRGTNRSGIGARDASFWDGAESDNRCASEGVGGFVTQSGGTAYR